MDHHAVSYIDGHMTCTTCVICALKEDQISRFCFSWRYICTAISQTFSSNSSNIPTISAVIDYRCFLLALLILILTRWVPQTKKLHPVVFIVLSAVIGIVFRMSA